MRPNLFPDLREFAEKRFDVAFGHIHILEPCMFLHCSATAHNSTAILDQHIDLHKYMEGSLQTLQYRTRVDPEYKTHVIQEYIQDSRQRYLHAVFEDTIFTDGKAIYYDPGRWNADTEESRRNALLHELMHIVLMKKLGYESLNLLNINLADGNRNWFLMEGVPTLMTEIACKEIALTYHPVHREDVWMTKWKMGLLEKPSPTYEELFAYARDECIVARHTREKFRKEAGL
jgi:hypothetical protein